MNMPKLTFNKDRNRKTTDKKPSKKFNEIKETPISEPEKTYEAPKIEFSPSLYH